MKLFRNNNHSPKSRFSNTIIVGNIWIFEHYFVLFHFFFYSNSLFILIYCLDGSHVRIREWWGQGARARLQKRSSLPKKTGRTDFFVFLPHWRFLRGTEHYRATAPPQGTSKFVQKKKPNFKRSHISWSKKTTREHVFFIFFFPQFLFRCGVAKIFSQATHVQSATAFDLCGLCFFFFFSFNSWSHFRRRLISQDIESSSLPRVHAIEENNGINYKCADKFIRKARTKEHGRRDHFFFFSLAKKQHKYEHSSFVFVSKLIKRAN